MAEKVVGRGRGGGRKRGRENFGFISCFNEVEGDKVVYISFSIPLVSNLFYLLKSETN